MALESRARPRQWPLIGDHHGSVGVNRTRSLPSSDPHRAVDREKYWWVPLAFTLRVEESQRAWPGSQRFAVVTAASAPTMVEVRARGLVIHRPCRGGPFRAESVSIAPSASAAPIFELGRWWIPQPTGRVLGRGRREPHRDASPYDSSDHVPNKSGLLRSSTLALAKNAIAADRRERERVVSRSRLVHETAVMAIAAAGDRLRRDLPAPLPRLPNRPVRRPS